ncbi:MAG: ImmA/IrrE family metallo-endopeptidase [Corynebacterium glucuronolyticum]|nr:ImmA/IrrE family metallo-endopeptidase [Mycobacteriaceae bacterium]MDY5834653.1 ImmA/IrrE family metallo-endopeptidase [Corynebacterium glucuronolyticum]
MSLDIHHLAQALQVEVCETDQLPANVDGWYVDAERVILMRPGLDPWNYRATLAHELAHAYFRDDTSDPRIERRADQWAAQMLITRDEYRAAEEEVGTSIGALAYHLDVTPAVIETWRDCYARARA